MRYAYVGYGTVLAATDDAMLVSLDDGTEMWVPFSQKHEDCDMEYKGDSGDVIIAQWLARKNDLDYESYDG